MDVSSSEDDLAVVTPLPATSPPTHNNMGVDAQTPGMDVDTRAAMRVPVPSELGNGEGKVGRVVEVPQPPPNKHSVDGDGDNAPARKKPRMPRSKEQQAARAAKHKTNEPIAKLQAAEILPCGPCETKRFTDAGGC